MTSSDEASAPLTRHARVWLDASTWRDRLRDPLDPDRVDRVDRWISDGRALVARRRDAGAASSDCFLGVALPIADDRRRIALIVDRAAVVRIARPLRLDEIVDTAPETHRAALAALLRRAEAIDVVFRVYGSFAWQAISGEPCVTLDSDIDLLWDAGTSDKVANVIALLSGWEADYGLRADGEACFANGDAVAWRELSTSAGKVLVKRDDDVVMASRSQLLTQRG